MEKTEKKSGFSFSALFSDFLAWLKVFFPKFGVATRTTFKRMGFAYISMATHAPFTRVGFHQLSISMK